ncbi:putative leader peptide [Streptomyces sp. NPDC007205]|uniref:putative leader peptide n=1 Tax=Streptomyces sp. NPDC007205 TaxID=3154316 RepID=UPI0033FD7B35
MRGPQPAARWLPDPGTCLTVRTIDRQPDRMPTELLLHGRVHVDLVRTASATCPGW